MNDTNPAIQTKWQIHLEWVYHRERHARLKKIAQLILPDQPPGVRKKEIEG